MQTADSAGSFIRRTIAANWRLRWQAATPEDDQLHTQSAAFLVFLRLYESADRGTVRHIGRLAAGSIEAMIVWKTNRTPEINVATNQRHQSD